MSSRDGFTTPPPRRPSFKKNPLTPYIPAPSRRRSTPRAPNCPLSGRYGYKPALFFSPVAGKGMKRERGKGKVKRGPSKEYEGNWDFDFDEERNKIPQAASTPVRFVTRRTSFGRPRQLFRKSPPKDSVDPGELSDESDITLLQDIDNELDMTPDHPWLQQDTRGYKTRLDELDFPELKDKPLKLDLEGWLSKIDKDEKKAKVEDETEEGREERAEKERFKRFRKNHRLYMAVKGVEKRIRMLRAFRVSLWRALDKAHAKKKKYMYNRIDKISVIFNLKRKELEQEGKIGWIYELLTKVCNNLKKYADDRRRIEIQIRKDYMKQ